MSAIEEHKGEPVEPMDPQSEFEVDMAKINADPKLAKLSLLEKQKIAAIAASTRMEARAARARAEEANARRHAKREKMPTMTVEEACFGPQPSKTMQRKMKQRKAAVPQTVPDLATMAEAEIQRANPAPDAPVQTARAKKLGHRHRKKMIEADLERCRVDTWNLRCKEWVERFQRIYAKKNPNASQAEVAASVTIEQAKEHIHWEDVCREVTLADIEDRGQLTTDQQREAKKIDARRQAELRAKAEEEQKEAEDRLSADDKREYALRAEYLARLQNEWKKLTLSEHEDRRAMRLSMAQQALLQRSIEIWNLLAHAFEHGAPLMMQGLQAYVVKQPAKGHTLDPAEAELDEDGEPVLARGPPGEPVYMQFNVRPESFMQYSQEWNPFKNARIVGLGEVQRNLAYFENEVQRVQAEDPLDVRHRLEDVMQSEEMFRDLARVVKTCNRNTHFVMSITVQCDTILDFRGERHEKKGTRWAKEIHGVFTHDRDTQDNRDYIKSLGPIKQPVLLCQIDKAFCLAGTAFRYGGKVPPHKERAQLTIKTCSKPECCAAGAPVFCGQACKVKHILRVHDATAVARKAKANKEKKARKRKNKLAALAAAEAEEKAMQNPEKEAAVVAEALQTIDERKERAEEAELAAMLEKQAGIESDADDEIEV